MYNISMMGKTYLSSVTDDSAELSLNRSSLRNLLVHSGWEGELEYCYKGIGMDYIPDRSLT